MRRFILFLLLVNLSAGVAFGPARAAETRISIGVTETMDTFNPYADSVSLMYSVWCQVLGCLGTYDFDKGQHVGLVLERWEVKDPNNWLFHVRKGLKFHNGTPVTAHDIVHSLGRTRKDPQSKQTQNIAAVASEKALNDYTVQVTTKIPTAPLLDYLFDRIIVTSKDLYDKYGPEVADRQYPFGAGPYKFRELIPGQRLVIGKDRSHPMWKQYPQAPDEIVFRIMREQEQRVTALLNNEIQIAQFVPPHLRERVERSANHKIVKFHTAELMFLAHALLTAGLFFVAGILHVDHVRIDELHLELPFAGSSARRGDSAPSSVTLRISTATMRSRCPRAISA